MKKSVEIRKKIFEILFEIYQKSLNFDESYLNFTKNIFIKDEDRAMILNVVLNSMRYNFFINKILKDYLSKRTSIKIRILLISAICQLLYLNFKDYAVTYDTVEIAKIKKLNPGLINSLLKNIIKSKEKINKNTADYSSIPDWFLKEPRINKNNIKDIISNFSNEPSLHLVFKNKKYLDYFNQETIKTTDNSAFFTKKKKISEIKDFDKGYWWVQDFASMLPIYLSPELKSKKIIDLCAAPGGKAFQILSQNTDVLLNDISSKRIKLLEDNLKRLRFDTKITNINLLNFRETEKFEVVVLDSPCSGIGTIRRNPEILFKKNMPDIEKLVNIQKKLINKASKLLKKRGILIYMVCSFFYEETKNIKKFFLENNKNFSQIEFTENKKKLVNIFVDDEGDISCLPGTYKENKIDGFYSVKFIKND